MQTTTALPMNDLMFTRPFKLLLQKDIQVTPHVYYQFSTYHVFIIKRPFVCILMLKLAYHIIDLD